MKCFIKTLVLVFMFNSHTLRAQNLVPNPSFEEYKKLNCTLIKDKDLSGNSSRLAFDSILYYWTSPTTGPGDVYNTLVDKSCYTNPLFNDYFGNIPIPKDGHFMTMIALLADHLYKNYAQVRSYIQTSLTDTLKAGKLYLGGGYWALGGGAQAKPLQVGDWVCNNLGLLYTNQPVGLDTPFVLPYHPQINQEDINNDRFNWKKFYGCFTATGNEQYLTLGNFYDDAHTKIELVLNKYDPGIDYAGYYIDSVFTEEVKELFIPNVITPNADNKNDTFKAENIHFGWWSLNVYNRWGRQVYHSEDYRNNWDGDDLSPGVYYYDLRHRCPGISYKGPLTIIR